MPFSYSILIKIFLASIALLIEETWRLLFDVVAYVMKLISSSRLLCIVRSLSRYENDSVASDREASPLAKKELSFL